MKKTSTTDYLACILFKLIAPLIRRLPLNFSLFLARRLGELFYYLDVKHKALAYANIRNALGGSLPPLELSRLTKEFYRTFAQNLIELFFIPLINKEYIHKYIRIEGLEHIEEGFKRGKGVILLAVHEGSWEFSNIICAILGFPFSLFIRDQGFPRLNNLLNAYRLQKGCRIIQKQNGIRDLIRLLKNNEAIGMTCDQGGKSGTVVKFFAKNASMPSGAIRLALKYDAAVIPVFYTRIKGPYLKIIIEPAFRIKKSTDLKKDLQDNLQEVVRVFEKYISRYPQEYLWTYKIWKYSDERSILILSDGKIGHLRQSEAVAFLLRGLLREKGLQARINTLEVKNKKLTGERCDFAISCGASVAGINLTLTRQNLARSIAIMRPSIFSVRRFDLVIMPKHDHPPKRKNVLVTEGALNLIDQNYLREQAQALSRNYELGTANYYIGLLIGGDTKDFPLEKGAISEVIKQLKSVSESKSADILISTSRRTPLETENLIKSEFKDYPRCKLLIIANEQNFPFTVGGILGLSKVVIVSAESISMISEAASSGRYIIVFKSKVNPRHNSFLNHLAKQGYIHLCEPSRISALIDELQRGQPKINVLNDRLKVAEALKIII